MYKIPRILIKIDNDQFTKPSKTIPSHELPFYLEKYGAYVQILEKTESVFEIESLEQEWTRLCTQYGENSVTSVFGRPPEGLINALEKVAVKEKNVKNTSKSSERTSSEARI